MTYSTLLENEGANAQFLCVMVPARRVSSWTLFSGSVYSNAFDYGYVVGVAVNGTDLTLGTSSSLSAGEFYWDQEASTLYVRKSNSAAPLAGDWIIVTYELHVATFDAHWFRVPDDDTTTVVYFEPVVTRAPSIKSTLKDLAFGLLPVQSTSITLNNSERIFEAHMYDGSFAGKEIRVYHWLGELDTDNMHLVMKGRMGEATYSDNTVNIKVFSGVDVFDKEFRSTGTLQFYSLTDYPSIDSNYIGRAIRSVYGVVDGFPLVNISYVSQDPTTSDNRVYAVRANGASSHAVVATVAASPAPTTTACWLNSAAGFKVGDSIRFDKTTDEYRRITYIDYGTNEIQYDTLSSGAPVATDTVSRGTVGWIDIQQGGLTYQAQYVRDWTESVDANGVLLVTLSTSLESNLSMPETLAVYDQVYARVYGKKNTLTLGGNPHGTNDSELGNLTSIGAILYDLLKTYQGLDESELELSSFTALLADAPEAVGFAVPAKSSDDYPKIKTILAKILQAGFIRLYLNDDQKWEANRLMPISSTTREIDNDEILEGSLDYEFGVSDIYSDFVVKYAEREQSGSPQGGTGYSLSKGSSEIAMYLHGVARTMSVDTYFVKDSEADSFVARLSALYGDRQGTISFNTKNRFFDAEMDERITVRRLALPGFSYDTDTERERDFAIVELTKGLRQVTISLSDLKGVNENSGEF
jgi:hypothetical protein